jgi:uncharacterized membrane protein
MIQVKQADVGQGVAWIGSGFRNFMKNPGMWIVLGLVLLICYIGISLIPFLGSLLVSLVSPVLTAGMLYAAKQAEDGQPVEFSHLFRGFQESRALNGLLALGAVMVAGTIASMIVMFMLVGSAFMASMQAGGPEELSLLALGTGGLIGLLLVLSIQLLVAATLVYAIPLVMFKGAAVGEAMSASINACIENWLSLLVFGAIFLIVAIVAALPFGLGLIVLLPASFGMLYASYRDIFGA